MGQLQSTLGLTVLRIPRCGFHRSLKDWLVSRPRLASRYGERRCWEGGGSQALLSLQFGTTTNQCWVLPAAPSKRMAPHQLFLFSHSMDPPCMLPWPLFWGEGRV